MYNATCRICGKEYASRTPQSNVCNDCKNRPCEICGKNFLHEWPYDQRACSAECRHKLRTDKTNIAQKEAKKRANLLEKYGVDNVSKLPDVRKKISDNRKSDDFKEKIRQTSLEKYGVEHFRKAPEVQEKTRKTMIERYGADNISKIDEFKKKISERLKDPEVREKYIKTSMEHWGVPYPHQNPDIKKRTEETMIEHWGVPYYVMLPEYRSSQATNQISLINQAIADELSTLGIQVEFEYRIGRKFYDMRIKHSNILIEVDPSYTHSDLPNHWCEGLPKNYHLDKTQLAVDNGYRCIHIFDWDNMSKICTMLKNTQRIYARQCEVQEVDPDSIAEFLDINHIQGKVKKTSKAYVLLYKGEVVEAMTFGSPRYNKNYEWELLRLCTAADYTVVGGASRLFQRFIHDTSPQSVISYCDRAKFTGSVYEKIGMTLHHISPPAKVWSKGTEHITDNLLRQRGYDQIFKTNYGKGTSNEELMIDHDWRSVYDCGQLVFEWRANESI